MEKNTHVVRNQQDRETDPGTESCEACGSEFLFRSQEDCFDCSFSGNFWGCIRIFFGVKVMATDEPEQN